MKNKVRMSALALLLAAGTVAAPGGSPAQAAAAPKPIKLVVNGNEIAAGAAAPYLDASGSVYIPLRMVSQLLKSYVDWDGAKKLVSVYAPNRTVKLTLGSKTAQVNDKSVALNAAAVMKNNTVYVPVRFVAQSLGANVKWQGYTVTIDDGDPYAVGYAITLTPSMFWLDRKTGDLYQSDPSNSPAVKTGKLDFKQQEFLRLSVDKLGTGGYVVTASDIYGEPHINVNYTTAYVKNKKLVDQAAVHYWQRMTANVTSLGNQAVLTDGKKLRILKADGTANKEYDLQKLGGLDEIYGVEGIGANYLLIRPNTTGLLMLVDPETGKKKALYELLDPADQEYAKLNDVPYHGDTFIVGGEHDGVIDLIYTSVKDGKQQTLAVKIKDWL
ncbi:copper amine oxidase N-terminal domain-containing protein [Cohnella rhizosphaerae]|uniref:Copper amine oxidase N-terminal domain-containing protein n=1 Tax=Cohnella rhizosphaerae TaxID=1457232 RepID=A0A9X4KQU9_9BACL|nr:copper amine oxidase N-terminal domain-containing protein [Cohnella rhizosphaerae]MDG0808983.1 copper amine oxidase N-terminal domain-containing protein [Cohnella rhizosphaerae]